MTYPGAGWYLIIMDIQTQLENIHRIVKQTLRSIIKDNPEKWEKYINGNRPMEAFFLGTALKELGVKRTVLTPYPSMNAANVIATELKLQKSHALNEALSEETGKGVVITT